MNEDLQAMTVEGAAAHAAGSASCNSADDHREENWKCPDCGVKGGHATDCARANDDDNEPFS